MSSKVYFIAVNDADSRESIGEKFNVLLEGSNLLNFIKESDKVAIKLHFGEEGNTGFVNPVYVKQVAQRILSNKASAVLVDTNTLYRGRRTSSVEHLQLAYEHGFTPQATGVEARIADSESTGTQINKKFIRTAHVDAFFSRIDKLIGIAHFKGHIMTGFGGALKNIGMGCATRKGKLAQHCDISPFVREKACIGCGKCAAVCPVSAISLRDKIALINNKACIGCATCIAVCPQSAIDVNWASGGNSIQEKMVEYAYAVLKKLVKGAAFINFAMKITKECDCLAKDDPKIAPDTGILVSTDPVSLDQASMDMVMKRSGKDIFKEAHPDRDGRTQLMYAAKLGLGGLDYELVELSL